MRVLSPRVHGILDYLLAGLFIVAPLWLNFGSDAAQVASFVIGGSLLLISLMTRYPLGVIRVIPFPLHGRLEFVASLLLIALPWLANFDDFIRARNFFLGTGIALFGVWAITDYRAAEQGLPRAFTRGEPQRAARAH